MSEKQRNGNAQMSDDSWTNTRMNTVQSPASITQNDERRGSRTQLLRACSLLGLALVVALAALFLSHLGPQNAQPSTQAARPLIDQSTR
jgi:hypothetical protein